MLLRRMDLRRGNTGSSVQSLVLREGGRERERGGLGRGEE